MKAFIKSNWLTTIVLIFALVCAYLAATSALKAEPLDTYQEGWHEIRAVAVEGGANFAAVLPIATNKGDFASKPTAAFQIPAGASAGRTPSYSPGSKWMFAFCGTNADNDTFSFNLVGWAKGNGMAQIICEGNGALGTQDVVILPGGAAAANTWWCDTLAIDETTKWLRDGDAANVQIYNSADNEVALLVIETTGLEWLQFVVYDADGSGTEMSTVGVYGRRF